VLRLCCAARLAFAARGRSLRSRFLCLCRWLACWPPPSFWGRAPVGGRRRCPTVPRALPDIFAPRFLLPLLLPVPRARLCSLCLSHWALWRPAPSLAPALVALLVRGFSVCLPRCRFLSVAPAGCRCLVSRPPRRGRRWRRACAAGWGAVWRGHAGGRRNLGFCRRRDPRLCLGPGRSRRRALPCVLRFGPLPSRRPAAALTLRSALVSRWPTRCPRGCPAFDWCACRGGAARARRSRLGVLASFAPPRPPSGRRHALPWRPSPVARGLGSLTPAFRTAFPPVRRSRPAGPSPWIDPAPAAVVFCSAPAACRAVVRCVRAFVRFSLRRPSLAGPSCGGGGACRLVCPRWTSWGRGSAGAWTVRSPRCGPTRRCPLLRAPVACSFRLLGAPASFWRRLPAAAASGPAVRFRPCRHVLASGGAGRWPSASAGSRRRPSVCGLCLCPALGGLRGRWALSLPTTDAGRTRAAAPVPSARPPPCRYSPQRLFARRARVRLRCLCLRLHGPVVFPGAVRRVWIRAARRVLPPGGRWPRLLGRPGPASRPGCSRSRVPGLAARVRRPRCPRPRSSGFASIGRRGRLACPPARCRWRLRCARGFRAALARRRLLGCAGPPPRGCLSAPRCLCAVAVRGSPPGLPCVPNCCCGSRGVAPVRCGALSVVCALVLSFGPVGAPRGRSFAARICRAASSPCTPVPPEVLCVVCSSSPGCQRLCLLAASCFFYVSGAPVVLGPAAACCRLPLLAARCFARARRCSGLPRGCPAARGPLLTSPVPRAASSFPGSPACQSAPSVCAPAASSLVFAATARPIRRLARVSLDRGPRCTLALLSLALRGRGAFARRFLGTVCACYPAGAAAVPIGAGVVAALAGSRSWSGPAFAGPRLCLTRSQGAPPTRARAASPLRRRLRVRGPRAVRFFRPPPLPPAAPAAGGPCGPRAVSGARRLAL